jgi:hypothetical protein
MYETCRRSRRGGRAGRADRALRKRRQEIPAQDLDGGRNDEERGRGSAGIARIESRIEEELSIQGNTP